MAAPISALVEAIIVAVNVETLNPWSIMAIQYCSSALARSPSASSPFNMNR